MAHKITHKAEIDTIFDLAIEVVFWNQGFQRKGYATIVASAMIEECLKRNFTIHWHCWKTNIGSIKTALKIGFELKNEESVLSLALIKEK